MISTFEVVRLWLARIRGDVGAPVGLKTSTSSIGEPLHPLYAVLDRYARPETLNKLGDVPVEIDPRFTGAEKLLRRSVAAWRVDGDRNLPLRAAR